ncbi:MAG: glycosyltransferase family 2 protein [Clostridia bacterium]|nr:glycosyltransferase family 2 protein [Clostridia bacterium]MDD4145563.1 glycosyltransferase family 2 protein [Clostridia bacterium]MDD4664961.1 glycosyltransferase family 2 protein [Clostridia bacterium]
MSVTAIIPAYNEEKYISNVLQALQKVEEITQIIVVSDGSTDNTVQEALSCGVQVINLPENIGKGGALTIGLKYTLEDIVLFLDADLIGLTEEHIFNLIRPVMNGQAEMTVGIFEKGRLATDMAQAISPYLSGQRCIKKRWLEQIDNLAISGFGVEKVVTNYAQQKKLRTIYVHLPKMSHVMKEEKLGLVRGFLYRMKMYWEIAKNVRLGG